MFPFQSVTSCFVGTARLRCVGRMGGRTRTSATSNSPPVGKSSKIQKFIFLL